MKTNNRNSAWIALLCLAFAAAGRAGAGATNWMTEPGMILTHWLWMILGTLAQTVGGQGKRSVMLQRGRVRVEHGIEA